MAYLNSVLQKYANVHGNITSTYKFVVLSVFWIVCRLLPLLLAAFYNRIKLSKKSYYLKEFYKSHSITKDKLIIFPMLVFN